MNDHIIKMKEELDNREQTDLELFLERIKPFSRIDIEKDGGDQWLDFVVRDYNPVISFVVAADIEEFFPDKEVEFISFLEEGDEEDDLQSIALRVWLRRGENRS